MESARNCPYCGKEFDCSLKHNRFAAHKGSCSLNPNSLNRRAKLSLINQGKRYPNRTSDFVLNCKNFAC